MLAFVFTAKQSIRIVFFDHLQDVWQWVFDQMGISMEDEINGWAWGGG